jgi:lipopolysaccharide biosynthesis glycosyltransferase
MKKTFDVSNSGEINLVYAFDKVYFHHAINSIKSFFQFYRGNHCITVYFLIDGYISYLEKIYVEMYIKRLKLICVNNTLDLLTIKNYYYTRSTYTRFFLNELLPHLHSAIYIDPDTLFIRSFTLKIFDKFIDSGKPIGVVPRDDQKEISRLLELGMNSDINFNAGFIFFNFCAEKIRKNQMIEFMSSKSERILFADQDALNVIYADADRFYISEEVTNEYYNYIPIHNNDISEANEQIKLIHFAGHQKPWWKVGYSPSNIIYWSIVRKISFISLFVYITLRFKRMILNTYRYVLD